MPKSMTRVCSGCGEPPHIGKCYVAGTQLSDGRTYIGPVKIKGKIVRKGHWRQITKKGK